MRVLWARRKERLYAKKKDKKEKRKERHGE